MPVTHLFFIGSFGFIVKITMFFVSDFRLNNELKFYLLI
jgi:hypothetical protein